MKRFYKNNWKRFWFTLIISFVSMMSFATTYYVSSSAGNDSNNGTSSSTPWKTLTKVNYANFNPGDFILFKSGDSWFGQLLPKSGSTSGTITYGSYGSGEKPKIHQAIQLNNLTDWVNDGGNIWKNSDINLNTEELLTKCDDTNNFSGLYFQANSPGVASKSIDASEFHSGTKSFKIACTTSGNAANSFYLQYVGNSFPMTAGKSYEFSFWVKGTTAGQIDQAMPLTSSWKDVSLYGGSVSYTTSWTKITYKFLCTSDSPASMFLIRFGKGLTAGNSLYFDDFSFKEINGFYAGSEVSNIVFNGTTGGARKWSQSNLTSQGNWFWDKTNKVLKVYSTSNPASYYSNSQIVINGILVLLNSKSYCDIDGFALQFGDYGIVANSCNNINIQNCDISWIGGSEFSAPTRKGNGIEFWANASNVMVQNCKIWQCYDAGITNQSSIANTIQNNITYRNNQVWNCEYSYEYFNTGAGSTTSNIFVENNTFYSAGSGWGHNQREASTYTLGYHLRLANRTEATHTNFIIKNNIFYSSVAESHHNWDTSYSRYKIDYNLYYQPSGNAVGINFTYYYPISKSSSYQSITKWDTNSKFVTGQVFTNAASKDFSLISSSPAIDAGDPTSALDPDGTRADIGAVYFNHPKVSVTFTEYKSICDGSNYNGWTVAGTYERTLVAKSGADSIVTTHLTVNPKYSISESISINEGENYNGWTTSGTYTTRKLSSINGCDSTVTTNLTVAAAILKQGDLAPTHFKTVWLGQNGLNHMNIIVVSALIENVSLSADDEIAVFSKSLCVGAGRLSSSISSSDNTTYLTISASQNDGTNNGFTENDTIIFKIWDSRNQKELTVNKAIYKSDVSTWKTSGKFAASSTAVAEIENYMIYTQNIELQKGYNMVSTYLTAQDPNVASLTKPLVDDGNLIKLQDETGNSLENWGDFGGWINKVGSITETEGYKIQVANNCTLQVTGRPIAMPLDVYLKAGWNIISFPKTELVNAMTVVQSLIDQNKLIKVQDEAGNSIENWGLFGGWKNGIGNFIPGKAYKVKMSSDATLTFQESYTKSVLVNINTASTEHFIPAYEGNGTDHMNLNISGLNNSQISIGDELAAFDGNICVGAVKITNDDLMTNTVSLVTSYTTNDKVQNGFKVGDQIQIITWNKETNNEANVTVEIVSGQTKFEKNATSFVSLKSIATSTSLTNNLMDEVKIDVYPNPCQGKFNVRFSELPEEKSRVEVTDVSGRKVISRMITDTLEEFELNNFTAGMYFVKSVIGSKEYVHKLIVNK